METMILYLQKKCNTWYRLAAIKKKQKKIISWFFLKIFIRIVHRFYSTFVSFIYGAYLPYQARIGNNIFFGHSLFGIFISQGAKIGDDCIILHQVTIGSNQPKSIDAPIIGKSVYIGCGCNIIGKTKIGDFSKIGAGTTIVDSNIVASSTVVGQKYRIFRGSSK